MTTARRCAIGAPHRGSTAMLCKFAENPLYSFNADNDLLIIQKACTEGGESIMRYRPDVSDDVYCHTFMYCRRTSICTYIGNKPHPI